MSVVSTVDDGVKVELEGGAIDASRWAKSVGLPSNCQISASLVHEGVHSHGSNEHNSEAVASLCMAILDRVKRLWVNPSDAQLRFMFKAGSISEEIELEAIFLTRGSGDLQLVVKRVSA
jgi:hypothetical protein